MATPTMVFINKSKIHFESKSQPDMIKMIFIGRCLSISQRYILKANHNGGWLNKAEGVGVYQ